MPQQVLGRISINRAISSFATIFPKVVCCRGVTNGLYVGNDLYLRIIILNIIELHSKHLDKRRCFLLPHCFQKLSASHAFASEKQCYSLYHKQMYFVKRNIMLLIVRSTYIVTYDPSPSVGTIC